ncbi:MAG: hypothetical protein Q4F27_01885 [Desulfovibrionaceae bacterium]|nr:hypothetical protein [Desulfovibrionaceae bacterium]
MGRLGVFLAGAVFCLLLCAGCERLPLMEDDLTAARQAVREHNWPLAERLLERVLRNEQDAARRWEAWTQLLEVINAISPEPRTTLEYLEVMRDEFVDDDQRSKHVLEQMGHLAEQLHLFERAAEIWNAYTGLAWLDSEAMVQGHRRLAAMQFRQRLFEAMEDTLQQCLALPLPEEHKIMCMYDLAEQNVARLRWQEAVDLCQQMLESLGREGGNDSDGKGLLRGQILFLSGDALEQLGRREEALRQFELARETYPNPAVVDNRIAHLRTNKKK